MQLGSVSLFCLNFFFLFNMSGVLETCLLHVLLQTDVESLFGGSSKGSPATRILLTEERSSSNREGRPLQPRAQPQGGRTWSREGGRGHPPSQPDQLNQPWQSVG